MFLFEPIFSDTGHQKWNHYRETQYNFNLWYLTQVLVKNWFIFCSNENEPIFIFRMISPANFKIQDISRFLRSVLVSCGPISKLSTSCGPSLWDRRTNSATFYLSLHISLLELPRRHYEKGGRVVSQICIFIITCL